MDTEISLNMVLNPDGAQTWHFVEPSSFEKVMSLAKNQHGPAMLDKCSFYPKALDLHKVSVVTIYLVIDNVQEKIKMWKCSQEFGDLILVPIGWMHWLKAKVNIEEIVLILLQSSQVMSAAVGMIHPFAFGETLQWDSIVR